jgi:DNA repair exonuclease SbcCD ATPase subunit
MVTPPAEIPGALTAESRAEQLLGKRSDDQAAALRGKAVDVSAATDRLADLRRREVRARVELSEREEIPAAAITDLAAQIEKTAEAATVAAQELAALNSALDNVQAAADNAQRLAALALAQIEGPCPVCQQEHDVEHTRAHLQQLLTENPELQSLTETVEAKRRKHDELQRELAEKRSSLNELKSAVEERNQLEELLSELQTQIDSQEEHVRSLIPDTAEHIDPGVAGEEARRELEDIAASLEGIANAQARSQQAERRVVAAKEQESTREKRHAELVVAVSRAEERAEAAGEARSELGRKINDVMAQLSNSSAGLINAIYSRLDVHPTFREFEFRTDRYRDGGHLRPWVCDRRRSKDGNALHVLSAAQLNSLAICLFLALNLERDSDLRTAILDDPVQSLDDVNLLSLADVLRTVRDHRQVVVSTHDEVLAELLIRKLRPLRSGNATAVVTIDQWSESGPRINAEMRSATGLEPEFQLLAATS